MIFMNNKIFISEEKLKLEYNEFAVVPCFINFINFNLDDVNKVKKKLNSFYMKFYSTFCNLRNLCLNGQLAI